MRDIARDLVVGLNTLEMGGNVGRNAKIYLSTENQEIRTYSEFSPYTQYVPEKLPAGIRFSNGASVAGNLTYESLTNLDTQLEEYVAGDVIHTPIVRSEQDYGRYSYPIGVTWVSAEFTPGSSITCITTIGQLFRHRRSGILVMEETICDHS